MNCSFLKSSPSPQCIFLFLFDSWINYIQYNSPVQSKEHRWSFSFSSLLRHFFLTGILVGNCLFKGDGRFEFWWRTCGLFEYRPFQLAGQPFYRSQYGNPRFLFPALPGKHAPGNGGNYADVPGFYAPYDLYPEEEIKFQADACI